MNNSFYSTLSVDMSNLYFLYTTVSNVTTFNKYIYERAVSNVNDDMTKDSISCTVSQIGDSSQLTYYKSSSSNQNGFNDIQKEYQPMLAPYYIMDYCDFTSRPIGEDETYYGVARNYNWFNESCKLHLIGTPDDIDELSMFPGIMVREVSDETHRFISDYNCTSILHTKNQHIKCKYVTYYDTILADSSKPINFSTENLYDRNYSAVFRNPKRLLETISPFYEEMLNPDERVYMIYIQMSDDLIKIAYERLNFFLGILNSKEKISIKNFLKYLS